MTVHSVGAYAGNTNAPVDVVIDYFYNNAAKGPGDENGPTLEVLVDGEGMVTEDPDKAVYQCNEKVELTANADTDWQFDSWSGDLVSITNPINVTMDNTKVVTATFVKTNFPIYLPIVMAD
jgi:hypothetical protein